MTGPVGELAAAVRSGDRAALPRAITMVESTRADHREQAQQLLLELMPEAGTAMHVGITGVPGVGTFRRPKQFIVIGSPRLNGKGYGCRSGLPKYGSA